MPNDTNKQWSNDFYRLVEDYEYGVIGTLDFKGRLRTLGMPEDFIEWLVQKMTENRSPYLD